MGLPNIALGEGGPTIAVFRRQGLQIMCHIIFRILFKNPFIIHPGSGSLKFQGEGGGRF